MISTRGRYALRVMMDLAEQAGIQENKQEQKQDQKQAEGNAEVSWTPLKDIAERQGISKKYLEILVKELVNAGLVTGMSGKGGGYRLCRKPEEYSVGEILELMEGSLASVACLAGDTIGCEQAAGCRTLPMWEEYDRMTHDFFYGKKLSDLLTQKN